MIREDIGKHLIWTFPPLEDYMTTLDQRINQTVEKEIDSFDSGGARVEYLDHDNRKITVYVNTVNGKDKYISFYLYNVFGENVEMIDFLLRDENRLIDYNAVIRYSAIFYENDLAKVINAGYRYQNNEITTAWQNRFILTKELGHKVATIDNLANMSVNIKRDNISQLSFCKSYEKVLKLHF